MRGCSGRFAILLILATGALLLYGGNGLLEGLRYQHPATISYDQFAQQKPSAGWYHIQGGVLVPPRAIYLYQKDHTPDLSEAKELYVPMQNEKVVTGDTKDQTIYLLVKTSDPAILQTFRDSAAYSESDKAAAKAFLIKNLDRVFVTRDVEGLVKTGLNSVSTEEKKVLDGGFDGDLAPNYVVLEEGSKPSPGTGLAMFLGGIVLLIGQVLFYIAQFATRRQV